MNNFVSGLARPKELVKSVFVRVSDAPVLIEGVSEYDCLCPVSKVTGHRGNPLSCLKIALSDKNSRLLDAILQEVPAINSDPRISDEDKLATLVSRLDTGTKAESDQVARVLSNFTEELFGIASNSETEPDGTAPAPKIEFNPGDGAPASE